MMMMTSLSTAVFRKLRSCPSAETLLLYTEEGLQRERLTSVTAHLAACDFCGAELKLLSEHPPCGCSPAATQAGEMPSDLRRLAEDILAVPSMNRARYIETAYEFERLTLTDACESLS